MKRQFAAPPRGTSIPFVRRYSFFTSWLIYLWYRPFVFPRSVREKVRGETFQFSSRSHSFNPACNKQRKCLNGQFAIIVRVSLTPSSVPPARRFFISTPSLAVHVRGVVRNRGQGVILRWKICRKIEVWKFCQACLNLAWRRIIISDSDIIPRAKINKKRGVILFCEKIELEIFQRNVFGLFS